MSEPAPEILFWTVYRNPADYPGKVVVRVSRLSLAPGPCVREPVPDLEPAFVGEDLDAARAVIPEGYYRTEPMQGDDPVIVECWL